MDGGPREAQAGVRSGVAALTNICPPILVVSRARLRGSTDRSGTNIWDQDYGLIK